MMHFRCLLLSKIVSIYAFSVCKILSPENWVVYFFLKIPSLLSPSSSPPLKLATTSWWKNFTWAWSVQLQGPGQQPQDDTSYFYRTQVQSLHCLVTDFWDFCDFGIFGTWCNSGMWRYWSKFWDVVADDGIGVVESFQMAHWQLAAWDQVQEVRHLATNLIIAWQRYFPNSLKGGRLGLFSHSLLKACCRCFDIGKSTRVRWTFVIALRDQLFFLPKQQNSRVPLTIGEASKVQSQLLSEFDQNCDHVEGISVSTVQMQSANSKWALTWLLLENELACLQTTSLSTSSASWVSSSSPLSSSSPCSSSSSWALTLSFLADWRINSERKEVAAASHEGEVTEEWWRRRTSTSSGSADQARSATGMRRLGLSSVGGRRHASTRVWSCPSSTSPHGTGESGRPSMDSPSSTGDLQ